MYSFYVIILLTVSAVALPQGSLTIPPSPTGAECSQVFHYLSPALIRLTVVASIKTTGIV